jgi:SAM-dependent methyltransferase
LRHHFAQTFTRRPFRDPRVRFNDRPGEREYIVMRGYVVELGNRGALPEAGGRLDAPAFHRNHGPIWSMMSSFLNGRDGHVLELGSGTGQHAIEFARRAPQIVWWPSDCDETHLRSIAAWGAHAQLANLKMPLRIDIAQPEWSMGCSEFPELTAIVCINVLHIAPWMVSEGLLAGAARYLTKDGRLFVYGPFMRDGRHTAPSNAAFDRSLRRQNSAWGVRDTADLADLANRSNLELAAITQMPANNLICVQAPFGMNSARMLALCSPSAGTRP